MATSPTFQKAFDVFTKELREDEGLYMAYKANIAMSFYDAVMRRKDQVSVSQVNLHSIANEAANNFLKLLIQESAPAKRAEAAGQVV